jgi:bifunctional enzyme CysN/CysC
MLAHLEYPKVAKSVIYSPTIYYDGWNQTFWERLGAHLIDPLRWIGPLQHITFQEKHPFGIKDDRMRRFIVEGASMKGILHSMPVRALHKNFRLNKEIRKRPRPESRDLVGWSEETFRSIEDSFKSITSRLGFQQAHAIPISARHGDNVVLPSRNMPWYEGKTLSAFLEDVPSRKSDSRLPFRLPVQTVLRDGHGFRALAGTIASGFVRAGDEVVDGATGLRAKIARIATMDGDLETASAGMAISLVLDKDLDISRGAVLSTAGAAPIRAYRLEARLIWLSSRPFDAGRRLLLRTATDLVPVTSIGVTAHLDLETLHMTPASTCVTNQIAAASIALGKTTAVDVFGDQGETGTFLLVDLLTGETLAAGVIAAAEEEGSAVKSACFHLTRDLLSGLCADLGCSDRDVAEYRRRAHEVLRLFEKAGVAAVLDGDSFEAGAEERDCGDASY